MATIRLIPGAYTLSNTNYLQISNAENMYTDTDSTTYGQVTHNRASSTAYYLYLHNFNFSSIPTGATISAFTVKIRGLESGLSTNSSYRVSLYNSNTALSNTTASTSFSTTAQTITIPTGNYTWSQISGYGNNFRIRVPLRRNSSNTSGYVRIYGAEIEVTYTAASVPVTGVSLDKTTASIEVGQTLTLTETIEPSNATDKAVTWSTSQASVATVSSGTVTAVSAGTAVITVTTHDGNKTASCSVTVTEPVLTQYRITNSVEIGKSYILANGDTGTVYMLSNEANGSRTLKGIAATVSNGIISISGTTASKVLFEVVRTTAGNDVTTGWRNNGQYIYSDNSSGLRMNAPATLDRFWHYRDGKFWQFKSTSSDGYDDTSSEYKYYITWSNGNATDSHVTSPSIEDTDIPLMYLYTEYTPGTETIYFKNNGSWVSASRVYKKINGAWVEQMDLSGVFDSSKKYVKG